MTYEAVNDGFKSFIDGSLPEDIDWTKTEIYAEVPEDASPNFWQKFLFGKKFAWDLFPQFYIKGKPGNWARIYDPNDRQPTKIIEHTQNGKIVKREISALRIRNCEWYSEEIRADWKWCLYRVLEGDDAPITTRTQSVSKYIEENK